MTVARPGRPPTQLDIAKQHAERAFGVKIAKRLDTFENGIFYVSAGEWARLMSWLVDFVFFVLCAGGGFVAFALATRDSGVSDNVAALTMVGLLVGVPVLYGLFFGNGRVLGAALTGTRLVRVKNGRRIGAAACWAMLVRTVLFPLLLAAAVVGGGTGVPGSLRRISVDDAATRQLHAAGFLRLDAPSQPPR
jgi:hypothetical protein